MGSRPFLYFGRRCREPGTGAVPAVNATRMGRTASRRNTMAKYLLLKHYRGAPASVNNVPMDQWTPEEISAHVQYMNDFAARLETTGEFVDGQALAPQGAFARDDGAGRAPARGGAVRRWGGGGPPAGHRRPVRRDEGPHRRLDGDRRRQLRARRRAGREAVGRTGGGAGG